MTGSPIPRSSTPRPPRRRQARPALLLALAAAPLQAAVLTVGPGGSHATLQEALTAAEATAAADEIRIAAGTLVGNALVYVDLAQDIQISGGWNAGYATRVDDPSTTVLQGAGSADSLLHVEGDAGTLSLSNLTLTHAASTRPEASCVQLLARGTMAIVLADSIVRDCVTLAETNCQGTGVRAYALADGRVEVLRNRILDNMCETVPPAVVGGPGHGGSGAGAHVGAQDNASLLVADNHIEGNVLDVDGGQGDGAGLYVVSYGNALADVRGNRIVGNRVTGEPFGDYPTVSNGYGAMLTTGAGGTDAGRLEARANVVSGNRIETGFGSGAQLALSAIGATTLVLGDTEVSDGSGGHGGIIGFGFDATATLRLVNLTVAGHSGPGLIVYDYNTAELSVHNSIVAFNGAAPVLPAGTDTGNNLFEDSGGADPLFSGVGDYRLRATSPARDAGGASPPGGLGATDVSGGARIVGAVVDIGAHEFGASTVFVDGFESP